MSTTSEHTHPSIMLETTSTTNQLNILPEQSLSTVEIERICKAFIRLISSPTKEIPCQTSNQNPKEKLNLTPGTPLSR